MNNRCQELTLKNTRCNRFTVGGKYCYQHLKNINVNKQIEGFPHDKNINDYIDLEGVPNFVILNKPKGEQKVDNQIDIKQNKEGLSHDSYIFNRIEKLTKKREQKETLIKDKERHIKILTENMNRGVLGMKMIDIYKNEIKLEQNKIVNLSKAIEMLNKGQYIKEKLYSLVNRN